MCMSNNRLLLILTRFDAHTFVEERLFIITMAVNAQYIVYLFDGICIQ